MNRWTVLQSAALVLTLVALGCSSGTGTSNPVAPTNNPGLTNNQANHGAQNTTESMKLWGYFDVHIDIESGTVEAVPNRTIQDIFNVEPFVGAGNLIFDIIDTPVDDDSIGVDINVGITHPFAGLNQYDGYDVRGVFIGDGSSSLENGGETYATPNVDQSMSNADGYTRWYNAQEFNGGLNILQYNQPALGTPGYTPGATLNPYKLYCDGLGVEDDAYTFICNQDGPGNNVFSAGTTNTRKYVLDFPNTVGVTYGYAIIASWGGEDPEFHPYNATEAQAISVTQTDSLYYSDGDAGGDLILDISLAGYGAQPSTIKLESAVLGSVTSFDASTVNVGGTSTYSTYHIEVPGLPTSTGGQDLWVLAEYGGSTYANQFDVPNDAQDDLLTAYFHAADLNIQGAPEPDSGWNVIDNGPLPVTPSSSDPSFSVVGDNTFGMEGVHYYGPSFSVHRYALDYSSDSTYMTLAGNYGYVMSQIYGTDADTRTIAVDGSGGLCGTTANNGAFFGGYTQNQTCDWWAANTPALSNGLVLTSLYGTVFSNDCDNANNLFGNLVHAWNLLNDFNYAGNNVEVVQVSLTAPYGSGNYFFAIDAAPTDDEGGNVDGEVSDQFDFISLSSDTDPQGLNPIFNVIYYYLEGGSDRNCVEVIANIENTQTSHVPLTTITEDNFVGTAVDIGCFMVYGDDPSATGNWLIALEDNGDSTWQIAAFDQDGNLISRSAAQTGDAKYVDCDATNDVVHVWADNAGTLEYTTLEWLY